MLLAGACATQPGQIRTETARATPSRLPTTTVTATLARKILPEATKPIQVTETVKPFIVSSPLQGIALSELGEIVSNPFQAPRPGFDDGHHGTDFAYYSRGSRGSILGSAVRSVLAGRVSGVTLDRPPYGNMILVETPFEDISVDFITDLDLPPEATPDPGNIRLTCPPQAAPPTSPEQSLYLLYAHLKDAPLLKIGDPVTSGQTIGVVGSTGASGNPHLHLEVRAGPAGTAFTGMSHYNTAATTEEMGNYCFWRVSGIFRMIDPMELLSTTDIAPQD